MLSFRSDSAQRSIAPQSGEAAKQNECLASQHRRVRTQNRIHVIGVGIVNRYLVSDGDSSGWILVDTGVPYTGRLLLRRSLLRLAIAPQQVKMIVLTHGHVDHAGGAASARQLTGAPIAIHRANHDLLERGLVVVPPLWSRAGRVVRAMLQATTGLLRFPRRKADVVIYDEGLTSEELGLRGRVVHTPGHTAGSTSLLLESGDAFVGDLVAGPTRSSERPRLPPAGDDQRQMADSLCRLLGAGAKMIYPGHGAPFAASFAREMLCTGSREAWK